jgi:hypothetical protein
MLWIVDKSDIVFNNKVFLNKSLWIVFTEFINFLRNGIFVKVFI